MNNIYKNLVLAINKIITRHPNKIITQHPDSINTQEIDSLMVDKRKINEGLNKNITLGKSDYLINYSYTQSECIGDTPYYQTKWIEHTIKILKVDGKDIPVFSYSWDQIIPESIIYKSKMVIRKYLESIIVKPSDIEEFINWNGDLNNWDE